MIRLITRSALRLAGSAYPFHRTGRIVHNRLTRWVTSPLLQRQTIRTRNGLSLEVVPADLIGRQLYLTGTFDPHLLTLFEALSRDAAVVVDVGANIGLFALSMAKAGARVVHAVEPQADVASMLLRSADASALRNKIHLHPFAISLEDGEAAFALDTENPGAAHIVEKHAGPNTITVRLRNGDKFLDSLGADAIDFMKVDVEGHEAQVFGGMSRWLSLHRIRSIVFETFGRDGDIDALSLISGHGYELYNVSKSWLAPALRKWDGVSSSDDMLAVSPEARGEILERVGRYVLS